MFMSNAMLDREDIRRFEFHLIFKTGRRLWVARRRVGAVVSTGALQQEV